MTYSLRFPRALPVEDAPADPHTLGGRFLLLSHAGRASARLTFGREMALPFSDSRILLDLSVQHHLLVSEIAAIVDVDKAQVSRAVARMTESGLVVRDHLRAPVGLTSKGRILADRLLRLSKARNRLLLAGVNAAEEEATSDALNRVIVAALARQVRMQRDGDTRADDSTHVVRMVLNRPKPLDRLLLPRLHIIARMIRREMVSRFGLPDLEWQLLSAMNAERPVSLTPLVTTVDRDKSQISRVLSRMAAAGLVEKHRTSSRTVFLSMTAEGARLFQEAKQRMQDHDHDLASGFTPAERQAFTVSLDRLIANAQGMLSYEQAIGARSEAAEPNDS